DLVVQPIDRDGVMPVRRQPVREPSAAGPEIQRSNRSLPDTRQRALLKVRITLSTDAPLARTRIGLRDDWQHPVILRRRVAMAVLRPNRPVLVRQRLGTLGARRAQKAVDPIPPFVPMLA